MYYNNEYLGPKVSILIATYNQPQYINQAVKSALDQDYRNLEIVVSDDSLNNHTEKNLQAYRTDPRLSYYRNEKNIGRVANYKRLLYELAKGEWVVMLDGDDYYIDNSYISKAVSLIEKDPSIVLIGAGHEIYNENKSKTQIYKLVDEDVVFQGTDLFIKKLQIPQHTTEIYLRALALTLDFYRHPSNASDAESLFRLCLHGRVCYLSDVPVVWRIHERNATYTRAISKQIKELNFIDSVYRYSLNFLNKNIAKEWRFHQYKGISFHILDLAYRSGQFGNILKVSFAFWKYWGLRSVFQVIYRYLDERSVKRTFLEGQIFRIFIFFKRIFKFFKRKI